jgi:hypothetical protein
MLVPEVIHMTKSTITKVWFGGLIVFAAGLLLAGVGVFLMLVYGGTFNQVAGNPNTYDFVPRMDSFFWTTVAMISVAAFLGAVGGIVQLAAWIGGLVNSYQLPDKTWFWILVLGGMLGLFFGLIGFAAMVAYVIAAPDGTQYSNSHTQTTLPKPTAMAPAS